jgi:hypothetical protein
MPEVLLIDMGNTAASALDSLVETCTVLGVVRAVRPVPAASVVRSIRATLGLRTGDLLARTETLERELAALRAQQLKTGERHVHV